LNPYQQVPFQCSLLAGCSCPSGDSKAAWQWLEKAMDKSGDKIKLVALDEPELGLLWVEAKSERHEHGSPYQQRERLGLDHP